MSNYSVTPKGASSVPWIHYPQACLGISIGNTNENGEKFQAIVEWINTRFKVILIGLSDTLARWNETGTDGALLPDAHERAKLQGDEWLKRNKAALSSFVIPHKIIRWDNWLSHPEFEADLSSFEKLYKDNEIFQRAVDLDVSIFLKRRQEKASVIINDITRQNCLGFLLEELAAYTILFRTYPNTLKIYPGGNLNSQTVLRSGKITDAPIGMQGVPFVSIWVNKINPNNSVLFSQNESAQRVA